MMLLTRVRVCYTVRPGVSIYRCLHKSPWIRITRGRSKDSSVRSYTQSHEPIKHVLLYQNQSRPKFVLLVSVAAGIQLIFWSYLSVSALNDYYTSVTQSTNQNQDRSGALADKVQMLQSASSLKWRVGFSLLALSLGAFFGLTAIMYPRRMVNKLVFNKGNNELIIYTNTPIGGIHTSKVSILDVHPSISKPNSSHLALKVKGHRLFYLLDKKGEFPNMKLFNTLIGSRTNI